VGAHQQPGILVQSLRIRRPATPPNENESLTTGQGLVRDLRPQTYGSVLAGSAAARRVVEANVAAAALFQAALQRRTAGLQDRTAGLIAAGARDAAAILCVFTLADAAGQVALADA
jgi:hypothetical protein